MALRFEGYELDIEGCLLRDDDGETVHLEPQAFDVLVHLASHRQRVVTKHELMDEIWGSRFVSESALTTRIKSIRSAVGDSGRAQRVIRTVHGKGYQFVAAVEDEASALPADTRAVGAAGAGPLRRLPTTTNRFWGRTEELSRLGRTLADERLVTVIGPGGTGKTRLCVELAHALPDDRSAVFLDLAAVRDEGVLGQALAGSLGIEAGDLDDPVEAACTYMRVRPLLLIVDNCEHVSAAAADLVRCVLDQSGSTTVLATSRLPLGLREEVLFRLDPLPVLVGGDDLTASVAAANAAVSLFVDRVKKVRQDFELDERSLPGVLALCRALDGLPLALELAAGRMAVFGLDDLVARLDQRLDLLGDDRSDAVDRHRTLRATLDWSHELLDADGQLLFRHLSVFPAGLTLDALEWLAERLGMEFDAHQALNRLVAASLVIRSEPPSGTRYLQLESMRAFGLDQLEQRGETQQARDLAAEWVLAMLDEQMHSHRTPRERMWNDRIRRELPNIRQTRRHLYQHGRARDLLQVSVALDDWARLRDVSEIWLWADEVVGLEELTGTDRGRALAVAAQAAWRRGRMEAAADLATAAIDAAGDDDWVLARGCSALGVARLFMGDFAGGAEVWLRRVEIDDYFIDQANAAICHAYAGDGESARHLLEDVRVRSAELDWPSATAWAEYATGEVESVLGGAGAVDWLEAAVAHATEIDSAFTVGVAGVTLCTTVAAAGRTTEAAARFGDLIDHWLRSGAWTQMWTTLRHVAALLEPFDPAVALLIVDKADVDPFAPGMDSGSRRQFDDLRARLAVAIGPESRAVVEADVARLDRAAVAERARAALAGVT